LADHPDIPHFPRPAPIDSYGKGGFRFAGMSHRGSLLCLPNGIFAWPVTRAEEIDERAIALVLAQSAEIGLFLLGTGHEPYPVSDALRARFHASKIALEVMRTGQAANTYNILLGEGRRVGAGLIAVD
jgi:uncharacterized protein